MTDAIKSIKRKGKKITPAAQALEELIGEEERRKRNAEQSFDRMANDIRHRADGEPDIDYDNLRDVTDMGSTFLIKDVKCVGVDGKTFESYDYIHVFKDVVRDIVEDSSSPGGFGRGKPLLLKPYEAVSYTENVGAGMLLPSFALTCNILAKLFREGLEKTYPSGLFRILDDTAEMVVAQYCHSDGFKGVYPQNTVVDWKNRRIIHYPNDKQFLHNLDPQPRLNINKERESTIFNFSYTDFENLPLGSSWDTNSGFNTFMRNLTGLEDLGVLTEMGEYFGKPTRIYVDNGMVVRSNSPTFIGCNDTNFALDTNEYGLAKSKDAEKYVRAVRIPSEQELAKHS